MDFAEALKAVKKGHRARRALWDDLGGRVGTWIEIAEPRLPDGRRMQPQLVCPLPDGQVAAFTGGSWDLLADDWELVDGEAAELEQAFGRYSGQDGDG